MKTKEEGVMTLLGAAGVLLYLSIRSIAKEFLIFGGAYLLYTILRSGPF